MVLAGSEADDLVFDRWTIADASAGDCAAIERRGREIVADYRVSFWRSVSEVAGK